MNPIYYSAAIEAFQSKKFVRFTLSTDHTNMKVGKHLYHVYIMTNMHHPVLYTGMTGWGVHRILQHLRQEKSGFTKRYNLNKLIYYEEYGDVMDAINRENQIKRWSRKRKERLIATIKPRVEKSYY